MEEKFEKIEKKLDSLTETNTNQSIVLAKLEEILSVNTKSLIKHEKRTTISEERLHTFELKFEKHLSFIKGGFWVITGIFTLIKLIPIIAELYNKN